MPNRNNCPRCGSSERIPDVGIVARVEGSSCEVMAEVISRPRSLFRQGAIRSPLRATVCAECGFTEFYATEAGDLLSAHRTRQSSGEGG